MDGVSAVRAAAHARCRSPATTPNVELDCQAWARQRAHAAACRPKNGDMNGVVKNLGLLHTPDKLLSGAAHKGAAATGRTPAAPARTTWNDTGWYMKHAGQQLLDDYSSNKATAAATEHDNNMQETVPSPLDTPPTRCEMAYVRIETHAYAHTARQQSVMRAGLLNDNNAARLLQP